MRTSVFFILILSILYSCASPKMKVEKSPENQTKPEKIITTPIVEKHFYNKIGEKTDQTEFYIQQSVQDYFIKFCESEITREQLVEALSKIESPIKTLTLKIEIRDGEWDSCDSYPVQSRVGKYAVILSIE